MSFFQILWTPVLSRVQKPFPWQLEFLIKIQRTWLPSFENEYKHVYTSVSLFIYKHENKCNHHSFIDVPRYVIFFTYLFTIWVREIKSTKENVNLFCFCTKEKVKEIETFTLIKEKGILRLRETVQTVAYLRTLLKSKEN